MSAVKHAAWVGNLSSPQHAATFSQLPFYMTPHNPLSARGLWLKRDWNLGYRETHPWWHCTQHWALFSIGAVCQGISGDWSGETQTCTAEMVQWFFCVSRHISGLKMCFSLPCAFHVPLLQPTKQKAWTKMQQIYEFQSACNGIIFVSCTTSNKTNNRDQTFWCLWLLHLSKYRNRRTHKNENTRRPFKIWSDTTPIRGRFSTGMNKSSELRSTLQVLKELYNLSAHRGHNWKVKNIASIQAWADTKQKQRLVQSARSGELSNISPNVIRCQPNCFNQEKSHSQLSFVTIGVKDKWVQWKEQQSHREQILHMLNCMRVSFLE